jgi:hypothetical protein
MRLMEAWTHTPAMVTGRHLDVVAANSLATALHGGFARGHNLVRSLFLDPAARERYPDWDEVTKDTSPRCARQSDPTWTTLTSPI